MSDGKFSIGWLIALAVSVVGIAAPIVWDIRKNSSRLELQYLRSEVLISKTKDLSKLSIRYDDQDVDQVSRHTFMLANTGKRPIIKDAIIRPIIIRFDKALHILDAKVDDERPRNLDVHCSTYTTNSAIELSFDLLNPMDRAIVSVMTTGTNVMPTVEARIADVSALRFVDRREELQQPKQPTPWSVWLVGFFTCISLFVTAEAVLQVRKDQSVRKQYLSPGGTFPTFNTKYEYQRFFYSTFSYLIGNEKSMAERILLSLPEGELRVMDKANMDRTFQCMLATKCPAYTTRKIGLLAVFIGSLFILSKFM